MKVFIKNMVCPRCILVVEEEFAKLQIPVERVVLGEVDTARVLTEEEEELLKGRLSKLGFEWLEDKRTRLVEQVKTNILQLIYQEQELRVNLSAYLSAQLHLDYTYLSNLFSEIEGTTIEKYFIAQKIERVKELLLYDELSLSQIADQLSYSSVAHLSTQFKKSTGLTPTQFKRQGSTQRKTIDKL